MGKTRTSFKPGQSGNPNGRPASPEIAELRAALDKAKKETAGIEHKIDLKKLKISELNLQQKQKALQANLRTGV